MNENAVYGGSTLLQSTARFLLGLFLPSALVAVPFAAMGGMYFAIFLLALMLVGIQSLIASFLAELWLQKYNTGIFLLACVILGSLSVSFFSSGFLIAIGSVVGLLVGVVLRLHYLYYQKKNLQEESLLNQEIVDNAQDKG